VFERFDAQARLVVVLAQEEARSLQHPVIDVEHILLALSRVDARLVGASPDVLRRRVTELRGAGEKPSPAQMPLADEARRSLDFAHEEAVFRGHNVVGPAHVLLGLVRDEEPNARGTVARLGLPPDDVLARALRACERPDARSPRDVEQALREGYPVPVTLGGALPVGDLGHPRADARVLLAILAADGPAARLLREAGVEEDAVRRLMP